MLSEQDVIAVLGAVLEPQIGRPITELGMVRGVIVRPARVSVSLALAVAGHPDSAAIRASAEDAIRALDAGDVSIDLTAMNDQDRRKLRALLNAERTESATPFGHARVFAVASGKGGVGKSSIATNLAVAMARSGRRVALLDADVWGFSLPRMLGVDRAPLIIDGLLVPPSAHGVRLASVGLLTEESAPVIWRGPMLHKMLEQFVNEVFWDDPDVVLVDMPPGTGDVALSMARLVPDAEIVVVTTPQPAAQRVAQRAALAARQVKLRVAGVVENMSWFTGNDGERYELFGAGGGQQLARELGIALLGTVPLEPVMREGADLGEPVVIRAPESEAGRALDAIALRLLKLPAGRIRRPELRVAAAT